MAVVITGIQPRSGSPALDGSTPPVQLPNSLSPAPVDPTCADLWYTTKCNPKFDPAAANAVIAEILNFVNACGLIYDCTKLDNMKRAFLGCLPEPYVPPAEPGPGEIGSYGLITNASTPQPAGALITTTGAQTLNGQIPGLPVGQVWQSYAYATVEGTDLLANGGVMDVVLAKRIS